MSSSNLSSDDVKNIPNSESEFYFPFCAPLYQLLHHHPIRRALDNYHAYRLAQLILKLLGKYKLTLFGGYLRRWVYSSYRISTKTQQDEDVTDNAEKSFQDYMNSVKNSKFSREDFIDSDCDLDLRVEDEKQISIIIEALTKSGLKVIRNPNSSASRYGTGSGLMVTSLKVRTHDILSGFRSQVQLDLVYIQHRELWSMDFNVNALEFNLDQDKVLGINHISIAEDYINKVYFSNICIMRICMFSYLFFF